MDYEKKYNEALERAKELLLGNEHSNTIRSYFEHIFPELRESEDERIRAVILKLVLGMRDEIFTTADKLVTKPKVLAWLEKQKEPKPFKWTDLTWKDIVELEGIINNVHYEFRNGIGQESFGKEVLEKFREYKGDEYLDEKEQKPNSTEDMPYVADEHFFEREPADTFKYKLAEYMTRCCTKKEGPYGYEYGISAESILKMAKEELIKRGELKEQKPVAWSEEDKKILDDVSHILIGLNYKQIAKDYKQSIEKLIYARPSWKPSDEQMKALQNAVALTACDKELVRLYNQLKKL